MTGLLIRCKILQNLNPLFYASIYIYLNEINNKVFNKWSHTAYIIWSTIIIPVYYYLSINSNNDTVNKWSISNYCYSLGFRWAISLKSR